MYNVFNRWGVKWYNFFHTKFSKWNNGLKIEKLGVLKPGSEEKNVDFFIKVQQDFASFNPKNIETAIIKYLVSQADAVYQVMYKTKYFIGEPNDYIQFALENPAVIRHIADIANGVHQSMFGHYDHL